MSIQITPKVLGYPLQTATTVTLIISNYELSTATTTTSVISYVADSGGTIIGTSSVLLPDNIFTAYTHNVGSSGLTTVQDYVLSNYQFTRL